MNCGRATLATLCAAGFFVVALAGATPAGAAPPDPVDDGNGKQWRQLYETTGFTWSQVAQVCPRDGATPCSGSIGATDFTGWVWATADQVLAFMAKYEPAILSPDAPTSAEEWFGTAATFLTDMRWTGYIVLYEGYSEWTGGWTSSTDSAGQPMYGLAGYGWWPPFGHFAVGPSPDKAASDRGVFLWRSTTPPPTTEEPPPPPPEEPPPATDETPPTITPTVTGTAGSNGWYVSDVSVSWTVADAESAVTSSTGCDSVTVTADSTETTFTCEATSAGGTATASAVVKRDATAPTVTCASPAPVFQMHQAGAAVTASVSDATSGAANASAQATADTSAPGAFSTAVTGTDAAGNSATAQCAYEVATPTCNGLTATRVGTAQNDVINGTSGRDVIVALGGADTISGLGGNDVICAGDGPDTIDGGAGADWIDGGAGADELSGGDGDDVLDGGADLDSIRGDKGRDTCTSGEVRMSSC